MTKGGCSCIKPLQQKIYVYTPTSKQTRFHMTLIEHSELDHLQNLLETFFAQPKLLLQTVSIKHAWWKVFC